MANLSTSGRPQNFKNLSPFLGGKKSRDGLSLGYMLLGALGIIAAVALLMRALTLN